MATRGDLAKDGALWIHNEGLRIFFWDAFTEQTGRFRRGRLLQEETSQFIGHRRLARPALPRENYSMRQAVLKRQLQQLLLDRVMPEAIRVFTRRRQVSGSGFLFRFIPFIFQQILIEIVKHDFGL